MQQFLVLVFCFVLCIIYFHLYAFVELNFLILSCLCSCVFPVIVDIMLSQSCGKILVGDPHQQIYTFRGAVNALHAVHHTHIYYLTQVEKHSLTRKFQRLLKDCLFHIYLSICSIITAHFFHRASGLALRLPMLVLQYWTVVKK